MWQQHTAGQAPVQWKRISTLPQSTHRDRSSQGTPEAAARQAALSHTAYFSTCKSVGESSRSSRVRQQHVSLELGQLWLRNHIPQSAFGSYGGCCRLPAAGLTRLHTTKSSASPYHYTQQQGKERFYNIDYLENRSIQGTQPRTYSQCKWQ